MSRHHPPKLDAVWRRLDLDDAKSHAARLLRVAALRGIIDTAHADILGLSANARDEQLRQLVRQQLCAELRQEEKLRLGRGAPRATYELTRFGAQVCQALGHSAHAYGQTSSPARRHDLYLVDLALAARAAGFESDLETPIQHRKGAVRPDALLHAPDQALVAFELEGATDWHQRARLIDKVFNWLNLWSDSKDTRFDLSPDIRVLFLTGRAAELAAADRIWAEAIAAVRAEYGEPLPIHFWGQSIVDFSKGPGWIALDDFHRLDNPALAPDFGLAAKQESSPAQPTDPIASLVPAEATAGPVLDRATRLRLRAHARVFGRYLQDAPRTFSPIFFDAVRDIHALAFPDDREPTTAMLAIPWAALLTLRTWIHHYPELTRALQSTYKAYQRARHSGVMLTQQKATELVDAFLKFHGLRADGSLMRIWVARPGEVRQRSSFTVQVDIRVPRTNSHYTFDQNSRHLLPPGESPVSSEQDNLFPDRATLDLTARALEWVLQQLLDAADILEIKK